jgi:hypothetical protein
MQQSRGAAAENCASLEDTSGAAPAHPARTRRITHPVCNTVCPQTNPADIPAARTKPTTLVVLGALLLLFALSRVYILFGLQPRLTDVGVYFHKVTSAVYRHEVPYKDFLVEYPPVAWWIMYLPRCVGGWRITDMVPDYNAYRWVFRGLMFACDFAAFVLLVMIVRRRRPDWLVWVTLAYTLTTGLLGYVLYDRLDVGLLFLLMLWAECWTRSLEQPSPDPLPKGKGEMSGGKLVWSAAAYAALGLSISYKLIPILCIPFMLFSEWYAPRRLARLTVALLMLALTAVLPFAVQYAVSGSGVFALLQYHGGRGIQIESLFATLMLVGSALGTPVMIMISHGSYEAMGMLAQPMKIASTASLVAFLAIMGLWALVRGSRFNREAAYRTACFMIPASAILSNVLSPQYFVWALPLLLLVGIEIFPEGNLRRLILAMLLIVIAGLTTWVFPNRYIGKANNALDRLSGPYVDLSSPFRLGGIVIGARNVIYLGVIIWLGVVYTRSTLQVSRVSRPAS